MDEKNKRQEKMPKKRRTNLLDRVRGLVREIVVTFVFFIVAMALYHVHNRTHRKFLPMSSVGCMEKSFASFNIELDPIQFDPIEINSKSFKPFDPIKDNRGFSSSIVCLFRWDTDLLILENLFGKFCSLMNRSDSKVNKYLRVNSNMECESNPCSQKSLANKKWSLFRFRTKKKFIHKRQIKIIEKENLISLIIFERDIADHIFHYECTIYKRFLLMTLASKGFKLPKTILSQIFFGLILPNLVSKIEDIWDIPWVILEKILRKITFLSENIPKAILSAIGSIDSYEPFDLWNKMWP